MSRLVAQHFLDEGSTSIPSKVPTFQKYFITVLASLATSSTGKTIFLQGITQEYVQTETHADRSGYLRPPK